MAEMTREEVEERLEEFAAHKAVKEAHEGEEETILDTSSEKLENGEDIAQNATKEEKGDAEYESSEEVEYRGDFKPELAQLLQQLRMQQDNNGEEGGEPEEPEEPEDAPAPSAE